MKVECILRRNPPALVTLGITAYQFQPDEHGRHVCEVEDNAHLARLLSISEAYRLPGDAPIPHELIPAIVEHSLPTMAATLAPVDENVVKGSDVHPATFDLGGAEPVELADVVDHALSLSGLTTPEWNSLPDEDRHNFIDLALDDLDERPPEDQTDQNPPPVTEAAKATSGTAPVSDAGSSNGAASNANPDATAVKTPEELELEDLRAQYLAKFGRKPNHMTGAAKLRTQLAEAPASETQE